MESMIRGYRLLVTMLILLISSCNWGPKTTMTTIPKKTSINKAMHEVVVDEVLLSSNYVYARVREGDREFWISTGKQEVQEGGTYLYREALLKTLFESKEHNRIFDTLYMVTTLLPKNHGKNFTKRATSLEENDAFDTIKKPFEGTIKISELVENPNKYVGKMVELSGECTKVNPAIMNRNWIHLNDGSQDDFDLVITSQEDVEKGDVITVRGIVSLDKDFGSGYVYDILLEEGTITY